MSAAPASARTGPPVQRPRIERDRALILVSQRLDVDAEAADDEVDLDQQVVELVVVQFDLGRMADDGDRL